MFSKQYTSIKITLYGLLLLVCYLLQSVPSFGLRVMGNAPELLFLLCICVAFNESETFSAFFGLTAGLLNDIITDSIVGKSAIIFMFLGFFIPVLLRTLLRNFFLTYIFMSLGCTLVFLLIEYFFNLMFFTSIPFGTALMKIILPKFFFTGLLSYPLYFTVKFICRKFWSGGDLLL